MIKQTLTWTALPNGANGAKQAGTELRLSVYVAPRLWNDDPNVTSMPLSDFPDWLDWPTKVAQASFDVAFDGGPTLPAAPENVDLRSDLWQALFKPATTVKPFLFEDLSGVGIRSFSAGTIHDTIRGVYQRAAIDAGYGGGTDLPGRGVLAGDPDLSDIARPVEPQPPYEPPEDLNRGPVFVGDKGPPEAEPDPVPGDGEDGTDEELDGCNKGCMGCLLWPFQLIQKFFKLLGLNLFALPVAAEPAPEPTGLEPGGGPGEPRVDQEAHAGDGGKSAGESSGATGPVLMAAASAQQQAFDDLHAYTQVHTDVSVPLPTQTEIEDQYDFHQMISSLGDYPVLMRQLGLVVDLVVTLDANLPADVGKVQVVLTPPPGSPASHVTPKTHYDLGVETFRPRPRSGSDLAGGLLRLDDAGRFKVVQTDVAGGGLKLQNTATNLRGMELLHAWPANAPEDAGLPALQTAGISILRAEQLPELRRRFDHSFALNSFLAAVDSSPLPVYAGSGAPPAPSDELFADDLVRGYRLDIWDSQGGQWHSLCQRQGNYDFLEGVNGSISLVDQEEEGFVQMAATESLVEEPDREIKVHESLFTWDGWSLVAPRPGKSILPDQTTGNADNAAVTQFKLETAFRARPASLPRLRFGWKYRVRARMVDLAGNSVFGPDDAAFANTQPQATPEFQFNRYEPVAPPQLMLRTPPLEGESLEHLVVRSTIHDNAPAIANQEAERHVVPPKTSQHMAERHRVFDGAPDILTDQAAYDLASREAGSLTERMNFGTDTLELIPGTVKDEDAAKNRTYWMQANEQFEVAFLPDNFARGVLLMGLPGMLGPDEVTADVNKITFTGTWPDLEPFRLRLQGLKDGSGPPAQPSWDPVNRVLTAQVPQGETIRVRYSSYFDKVDLEMMGIWEWVKEANPADLAALEKLATDGRNWLNLPFRELDLVHAVQQPLIIPLVSQLDIDPDKKLGDTSVTLDGQTDIDAKSTGKIDLRAAWRDPFDDPAEPSFDAANDFVSKEMLVDEIVAHDRGNNQLEIKDVEHAFSDTKYHRVTYTAIGTTRYREYFPAAAQATPENLVRPTPAELNTPPADSARFVLDVPNSALPDAVKPLYAVPTFSWNEPQNAGGVIIRERKGGGLRLYMDRPWFSSGDGELLGLVLRRPADPPLSEEWMKLRKYASEWGMDPIWRADETAPLVEADFANAVDQASDLSLAEVPGISVDVVGFEAQYDTDRNLWFSDIALKAATQYFPFLRLALVRFQPISVPGAHLSRVVLSDFIQVLPHRTVNYDASQVNVTHEVEITVNGPAYFQRERKQSASPLVVARIERRRFETGDELGWETVARQSIPVVQQNVENTIWTGTVQVPNPAPDPMRIVVLEAEVYDVDPEIRRNVEKRLFEDDFPVRGDNTPAGTAPRREDLGYRVVFADAIELP